MSKPTQSSQRPNTYLQFVTTFNSLLGWRDIHKSLGVLAMFVAFSVNSKQVQAQGQTIDVAVTGEIVPGSLPGPFFGFDFPEINDNGNVIFNGYDLGATAAGIYHFEFQSNSLVQMVDRGQTLPDGAGVYFSFESLDLTGNDEGIFLGNLGLGAPSATGYYRVTYPDEPIEIAVEGSPAPLGGEFGELVSFNSNNQGSVFFENQVQLPTGESEVIFRITSTSSQRIARYSQLVPGGNGNFQSFHSHNVFIDPPFNANVFGPFADTHVQQLVVGGPGGASLELIDDVEITVDNGVAVNPNAELTGSGTINGNVSVRGVLRPSNGTDDLGAMDIQGHLSLLNSELEFDLAGTEDGEFDQVLVRVDFVLDGQLSVNVDPMLALEPDMQFTIIDHTADPMNIPIGQFVGLPEGSLVGNYGGTNLSITYAGGDCNDVVLFTTMPAPIL